MAAMLWSRHGGDDVISVRTTSRTRAVNAMMAERVMLVVAKAAFDIEGNAKQAAPVDTGNLKNSIQASRDGDAYRVDVAAEYAAHVEFGTRFTPAQPFFVPAIERVRPSFLLAMKRLT